MRRRLFQHFEQGIGCLNIHAFGRVHQHHAVAATVGTQVYKIQNMAYGVHFDLQQLARHIVAFGDFRCEFAQVGMAVLAAQMARRALAARPVFGLRVFAQQSLRQILAKSQFADAGLAVEQPSIGAFIPMGNQLLPSAVLPRIYHGRGSNKRCSAVSISALTMALSWLLSMTA